MLAEHELADLYLAERLTAPDLRARLAACLPPGYVVTDLHDVWVGAQALAPQLVAADYRANVAGVGAADLGAAVARLLAAGTLARERRRDKGAVRYDLRPLVMELRCTDPGAAPSTAPSAAPSAEPGAAPAPPVGSGHDVTNAGHDATLWMRLRHSQDAGTGRMEEVVAALAEDVGLRLNWFGGDDGEPASAATASSAAAEKAPATETVPAAPTSVPTSAAAGQVEVFLPVRERLWLAEELPVAPRSV